MQQLQEQVLDILAHVTGFREGRGIADREWHVEDAGQRPGQERLAGPVGPSNRMFDFSISMSEPSSPAPVACNDCGPPRPGPSCSPPDRSRTRPTCPRCPGRRDLLEELLGGTATTLLLLEDRLAKIDTLAADVHVAGPSPRAPHPIALPAERTKRVLLRRTTAPSASARISSSGHNHSFRIDGLPRATLRSTENCNS